TTTPAPQTTTPARNGLGSPGSVVNRPPNAGPLARPTLKKTLYSPNAFPRESPAAALVWPAVAGKIRPYPAPATSIVTTVMVAEGENASTASAPVSSPTPVPAGSARPLRSTVWATPV